MPTPVPFYSTLSFAFGAGESEVSNDNHHPEKQHQRRETDRRLRFRRLHRPAHDHGNRAYESRTGTVEPQWRDVPRVSTG